MQAASFGEQKGMEAKDREIEILAVLDRQVRPILAAHQGGIELTKIEAGVVHLRILGACAACIGAEQTIRDVIVAGIRESCPWITDVCVAAGVSDDFAREAINFLKKRRDSR